MKLLYTVFLISLTYLLLGNNTKESIKIPDDSLRFRIIANSNNIYDQSIKYELKKSIEDEIFPLVNNVNDKKQVKQILEENRDILNELAMSLLEQESINAEEFDEIVEKVKSRRV